MVDATERAAPGRLGGAVLVAFFGTIVFGGGNPIAIHFSNQELPPLYGAALRFGGAAILLAGFLAVRRIRLPTGSALWGSVAFGGLLATGNALGYWAILHVPAALAAVFLALVPLVTMLLAAVQGLERLEARGVAGGLLAVVGIALLQSPDLGTGIPFLAMLALIGTTVCAAEAAIVVKKYPSHHPAATNGAAMVVGMVVLLAASAVGGEGWTVPDGGTTWLALAHLVVPGTVGLFVLYLFVLQRWSASATSYSTVAMPVVAVVLGAIILGQEFTGGMALAAATILAGVYIGALSRRKVPVSAPAAEEALAQRCAAC